MKEQLRFFLNRTLERLWVKPLIVCALSIGIVFIAKFADGTTMSDVAIEASPASLETLLKIMSSSMLVIATLAVASMVSAYASASGTATPRSFPLIVSDDVSQNALSTFVGAFIFSIVALIALQNDYFEKAGILLLFALTLAVFTVVILTFVRWVDNIARLGRLGSTIEKVETVTAECLRLRRRSPTMGGAQHTDDTPSGDPVFSSDIGYVQRIDIATLQDIAARAGLHISIEALPGTFVTPDRPLAHVVTDAHHQAWREFGEIRDAFIVGSHRTFDEDPRFGLIVLSEIAGRALSPAVNDPGTAIDVLGSLIRLFTLWRKPDNDLNDTREAPKCPAVAVRELSLADMFDDAFTALARDGAGSIEVAMRLQKALQALACLGDIEMREIARAFARSAHRYAKSSIESPEHLALLRDAAAFAE